MGARKVTSMGKEKAQKRKKFNYIEPTECSHKDTVKKEGHRKPK